VKRYAGYGLWTLIRCMDLTYICETITILATDRLVVPSVKLSTAGSRAFPAAGSSIWNMLPENVVSGSTLQLFQHTT